MENSKVLGQNLKIALRTLGGSEALFQKMVDEVSDYAILILDKDGTVMNWNRGAQKIKGYNGEEIVGKNFRIFYPPEDRAGKLPEALLAEAQLKGKATHEGWRIKKDGSRFWESVVITALHDSDGKVIAFSKLTRDLTERKMAEEQQQRSTAELHYTIDLLRNSEERYYRMIAEVEDYAIILLDTEGNIQNWNKGAQKIKGYTESEIIGKNFNLFYLPEDRKNQLPQQLLAEAIANNRATHEGWRMRKDGTHFWGSIVITALHDEKGVVTGFSKVTRDRTQQKEAADHIILQNKQLEEYAYVASHDLQEPLRKILTFSSMLKMELGGNESARQLLHKMDVSVQRMTVLIRDVLNYSQASKDGNVLESVNINDTIAAIESDFELLLKEKNGKIVYKGLPTIHAVPIQMHQLFANLISNAIKFNNNSPVITISHSAVDSESSENESMLKFTVSDNGNGFDPIYQEQIFKMFHRLDKSDKLGTGIGLALCKKIVENHGGGIEAYSKHGEGAIFEIVLPQNRCPKKPKHSLENSESISLPGRRS